MSTRVCAPAEDDLRDLELRTAGLMTSRKAGRVAFYRLVDGLPGPLLDRCVTELGQLAALGVRTNEEQP